jgi:hypothetical protein
VRRHARRRCIGRYQTGIDDRSCLNGMLFLMSSFVHLCLESAIFLPMQWKRHAIVDPSRIVLRRRRNNTPLGACETGASSFSNHEYRN